MSALPTFEPFESYRLTVLQDNGSPWYLAKDLAPILDMTRQSIRMQIALLESEDVRVNTIDTNKGSRRATFVSQEGLCQIAFLSRKPEARRLRKFAAQLLVKYAKGELEHKGVSETNTLARLDALEAKVAELAKAQARTQYLPRPKSGKKAPREVSPATAHRLKTVERFLDECCERVDGSVTAVSALAARFDQWARDNGVKPVATSWLGRTMSSLGIPNESVGPERVRARPFIRLKNFPN